MNKLNSIFFDKPLYTIYEKILNNERLSFEDGINLYKVADINQLGFLANLVCEKKNGQNTYFIKNLHINYTNVCNKFCKFCSFYELPNSNLTYTLTPSQISERIKSSSAVCEVHIVGGINPKIPYDYYLEIIRTVKRNSPNIVVKAYTMVEIFEIARVGKKTIPDTLLDLKNAGLDLLPGGGAEVLSERVHQELFSKKIGPKEWIDIAKTSHLLGIKTNATMLYGHIETIEEKVNHLIWLRNLQDETNGFLSYIPLSFHPENTEMHNVRPPTGYMDLKEIALGRLMLDNFNNIKSFWVMSSLELCQLALWYGANDIDGTVINYTIVENEQLKSNISISSEFLINLIKEAGRIPVERDSFYNSI